MVTSIFKAAHLTIVPLLLLSLYVSAQTNGYELYGHIPGLKNGDKVIMYILEEGRLQRRKDSAIVANSIFVIKGIVPEGPRAYRLESDQHPYKFMVLLVNNGEKIQIESKKNIEQLPPGNIRDEVIIEGSPSDYNWATMIPVTRYYWDEINFLSDQLIKIKDSLGYDRNLIAQIIACRNAANEMLYTGVFEVALPLNNAIPLFVWNSLIKINHAAFLPKLYDRLDQTQQQSFYGKLLKRNAMLAEGQNFPSFSLPTEAKKIITLQDILKQGKLTLITFWSSDSKNLDETQQELSVYNKKFLNLNFVGINGDTVARKWKLIIPDMPGYQVSDLKGSNGIIGSLYLQDTGFATNVLLGSDGKIIAWDVKGVELQYLLEKYLQ